MKVLFCTDGSRISYDALLNFVYWVKGCVVDVLCVADWTFLPDTVSVEGSNFAMKCANSVDSILEYSEHFFDENNITLGKKIKMCGTPVDTILDVEEENYYDFLVMGSNGKKGFQKWLGSVSQELATVAKTSTYVSKGLRKNNNKILFTLDASDLSKDVVSESLKKLNLEGKEITLLTVYEMPDYLFLEGNVDGNWIVEVEKKQKNEALHVLQYYEKMFNDRGLEITYKSALKGNPAKVIIDYSDKNDIDLVISGIRTKKYYSRFFISSVSKRVLENVNSDVLIVKP